MILFQAFPSTTAEAATQGRPTTAPPSTSRSSKRNPKMESPPSKSLKRKLFWLIPTPKGVQELLFGTLADSILFMSEMCHDDDMIHTLHNNQ